VSFSLKSVEEHPPVTLGRPERLQKSARLAELEPQFSGAKMKKLS
jgi:hypothetical protein